MNLPTTGSTIIYDGQFNNAQTVNNFISKEPARRDPYQILKGNTVLDASFDSNARFDPPKCHPHTRIAILDHIQRWSRDTSSLPVLWIRGAAGAGKSAIAQTLSERWDDESILAATFYFSRTAAGRNEKQYLIGTLAYQLSISIPETRSVMLGAIERDPEIFKRNLRTQMKRLIVEPLVFVSRSIRISSVVVVIDGLDECCIDYLKQDHEQQQKEILECIQWAANYEGFPLRFLIASRPERQIREVFELGSLKTISARVVLDNTHNPAADIELYLRYKFEEIRRLHSHLATSWPPEHVICQLVSKSSGHFIYAAVVARYLSVPRTDPEARLRAILSISQCSDGVNPFAELDGLYMLILRSVSDQSLRTIISVFELMIYGEISDIHTVTYPVFRDDIKRLSPIFIAKYLFISLGELYLHLTDLHSILDIPQPGAASYVPLAFLHASFSEFLTQATRSQEFYLGKRQAWRHILSLSLQHVFVQALSPDSGYKYDYTKNGFALQTTALFKAIKPDRGNLGALRALVNQDETEFIQYIHQCGLTRFGTTRCNIQVFKHLYDPGILNTAIYDKPNVMDRRPVVLRVLKKYSYDGFVPIDPAEFNTKCDGVLTWFCNIYKENTSSMAKYHSPVGLLDLSPPSEAPSNQERNDILQYRAEDINLVIRGVGNDTPNCCLGFRLWIIRLFGHSKGKKMPSAGHHT